MSLSFTVFIDGPSAEATATLLLARLREFRADVEVCVDTASAPVPQTSPDGMRYETAAWDTPEFSVEKILDLLSERGMIHMAGGGLSDEEEARIRDRLRDLGYLE